MKEIKESIKSTLINYFNNTRQEIKYSGLFGSSVRTEMYRDIDIIVITRTRLDISQVENLLTSLNTNLNNKVDLKIYDETEFQRLVQEKSPLLLSIAAERVDIFPNQEILVQFNELRNYLYQNKIDVISSTKEWHVSEALINNILEIDNKLFRGFLVAHLDYFSNKAYIAARLLEKIAPLEEPYTRTACLKKIIHLIRSKTFRETLNIDLAETIHLACVVLKNRKSYDYSKFEDYDSSDLCLELGKTVELLDANHWNSTAKPLISSLLRDYNHNVRFNIAEFVGKVLMKTNPITAIELLVDAYRNERKPRIVTLISDCVWMVKDEAQILATLELFAQITTIDDDAKKIIKNLTTDLYEIMYHSDLELTEKRIKIYPLLAKKNAHSGLFEQGLALYSTYLQTFILDKLIESDKINVVIFKWVLEQDLKNNPYYQRDLEILNALILINELPKENIRYFIEVLSLHRRIIMMQLALHNSLRYMVLQKFQSSLKQELEKFPIARFFKATIKPRFGLKTKRSQIVHFNIKNTTNETIPALTLEMLSTAEVGISIQFPMNWQHTQSVDFKPLEEKSIKCDITPNFGKQIAISYKINGQFGEPIYISADRANPFVPNSPASSAHFVGRRREIGLIVEEIHQQHFLLFGPRRIGKTSLLYQLKQELKEGYIPIYLSLQQLIHIEGKNLFDEFMAFILHEIKNQKKIVEDLETDIIKWLAGERVVVLMDELDIGLEKEGFNIFLEKIRSLAQTEKYIRFIFSSGPFITKELVNAKSPLFNMVTHISIHRFSDAEAEKLLRLAEDQDFCFESGTIERCILWTGGLPLYLQILGHSIFQALKAKNEKKIQHDLLDQLFRTMANDKIEWGKFWESISANNDEKIIISAKEKAVMAILANEKHLSNYKDLQQCLEKITNQKISIQFIKEAQNNLIWSGIINLETPYIINAQLITSWLINHLYYPDEIEELFSEL